MDYLELLNDIKRYIGVVRVKDIKCCEDSTSFYDAYNNIDSMYNDSFIESYNINIFKEYINIDTLKMSSLLNISKDKLDLMFNTNDIPSKGLAVAICLVNNLDLDTSLEILDKLKYSLGNNIKDKIIRYFFDNSMNDIKLLNEVLLSFGEMYLYK